MRQMPPMLTLEGSVSRIPRYTFRRPKSPVSSPSWLPAHHPRGLCYSGVPLVSTTHAQEKRKVHRHSTRHLNPTLRLLRLARC